MSEGSEKTNLMAHYRALVASGDLRADPAQNLVVEKLSLLANRLERVQDAQRGFASALFGWGREPVREEGLKGLYIYGSVGRGKSMLMQLFVDAVGEAAWRVHFHEFMQGVQHDLNEIRKGKAREPLDVVADRVAKRCRVLCLDEMQVENIADAMIVGRLFEGIFARGVVLVTTSNRHPRDLYKGGLNRHRFTPFIDEIEAHCETVSLDGSVDYRQTGEQSETYFVGETAPLDEIWSHIRGDEGVFKLPLSGRDWVIEHAKPNAARLSFHDVCEEARGAQDYQKLAAQFDVIIIEGVPELDAQKTSAARRFVTLIDVLYEAGTKLYLGLDVPLEALHHDEDTKFVFERTLSRLAEMEHADWGASPKV